jgi:microcystin-dependent protein
MQHPLSRVAAALAMSSTFLFAADASACSTEPYIGTICATTYNFCPSPEYLPAQGQTLQINQYQALFALIGTNYGGDGRTNFVLPDLRGRVPVGMGQGAGLSNVTLGQKRGAEAVALNQSNLPAAVPLTVNVAVNTGVGGSTTPAGGNAFLGASPASGPTSATMWSNAAASPVNLSGVTASGGLTGGNSNPVATLSPELGFNYCIAVQGIFPQRP